MMTYKLGQTVTVKTIYGGNKDFHLPAQIVDIGYWAKRGDSKEWVSIDPAIAGPEHADVLRLKFEDETANGDRPYEVGRAHWGTHIS